MKPLQNRQTENIINFLWSTLSVLLDIQQIFKPDFNLAQLGPKVCFMPIIRYDGNILQNWNLIHLTAITIHHYGLSMNVTKSESNKLQHANSKAANFGDCDYDHDIHANGFIFFMVDPWDLIYCPFYSVFQNSTK